MATTVLHTSDGSHTLYVPEIDETYHSTHGAVQESTHIFIQAALQHCKLNVVRILEVGFGTGLNALLTKLEADRAGRKIVYTTLEKFPVDPQLALSLNYSSLLTVKQDDDFFGKLHLAPWGERIELDHNYSFMKVCCDFALYESNAQQFDLVFFDAFSPDKQPEMWTVDLLRNVYRWCAPQAILTTYCAKGVVRRALEEVGFKVERLPGPPGKREILRAIKIDFE